MVNSFKLSGWEYSMDNNDSMRFSVNPSPHIECPSELMKYYKITDYNIESLIDGYFYASHPFQLNDPFDCYQFLLDFDNVSLETYKRFYCSQSQMMESTIELRFKTDYERLKKRFIEELYDDIFAKLGIISLTTNPCDMLMWAHYSNHNGVLAVFDVEKLKEQFHGPFPINYLEQADKFDISINPQLGVFYMTNIKSNCWSYENEWRLIAETSLVLKLPNHPDSNQGIERKFTYSKDTLKEIVLGYDYCNNNIKTSSEQDGFTILDFEGLKDADLRVKLLKYIIENKIIVSTIQLDDNIKFKLLKKELILKYYDEYKYGFKIKPIAPL